LLQVAADVPLIWLALWLAFYVSLDDAGLIQPFTSHAWLFLAAPAVALPLFVRLGMYRAVMRRLGNAALLTIAKAVSLSALLLALLVFLRGETAVVLPRAVIFNYWLLSLLLLGGLRIAMRQYFTGDWYNLRDRAYKRHAGLPKVAIYGAGLAGNQLAHALNMGCARQPVAFIDDDLQLVNRVIAGLPVYPPSLLERMLKETGAEEILLAMPSTSRARRRQILEMLESCPLPVRTMPDIADLASGRVRVEDLKAVDIADLLGRDPVAPRPELLARCIRGQVVMVTGAGDLNVLNQARAVAQGGHNDLRNLAGRLFLVAGQKHGDVGGKVSMFGIPRNFDHKGGNGAGVQSIMFIAGDQGLLEQAVQGFFHVKCCLSPS
jgi:FlaA1/EpsC-like NDP-sugar epimerase